MKKLFSVLLALAMLLSCAAAFADAAPAEEAPEAAAPAMPLNIYSQTDIDRDVLALDLAAMGKDESFILKADTVAAVLTEADEHLVIADGGFQWDLILSGRTIFTVAGEMTDEGFVLGSNLFPNHVLRLSNEELAGLTKAFASKYGEQAKAMERIDLNALARAVNPYVDDFVVNATDAFKAGEARQGDYVLDGVSYNTMVPIDVDVAAISRALTQMEQELLEDPTVAVTIAQFDSTGKYAKAVEKAIDPANAPTLYLESYATVDAQGVKSGPVDTTFVLTMPGKKDPAAMGDVLVDGEAVTATVQFLTAAVNLTLSANKAETGRVFRADMYVNGLYYGCVAEVGERGEKYNDTGFYLIDPEKMLLYQRTTMTHEGERTFDLSRGTPVTLADLTAKDSPVKKNLTTDAMIGMAGISAAATEALPDEVGALLALFNLAQKG